MYAIDSKLSTTFCMSFMIAIDSGCCDGVVFVCDREQSLDGVECICDEQK